MTLLSRLFLVAAVVSLAASQIACPPPEARSESIDPSTLPVEIRADYEVFAQRCSKCHSLSRPLNSGIVDDDYWALYVARMRRQPASGISVEDSRIILRFLHYYSLDQLRKKQARNAAQAAELSTLPPAPTAGATTPAPTTLPPTTSPIEVTRQSSSSLPADAGANDAR